MYTTLIQYHHIGYILQVNSAIQGTVIDYKRRIQNYYYQLFNYFTKIRLTNHGKFEICILRVTIYLTKPSEPTFYVFQHSSLFFHALVEKVLLRLCS